ncbi:EamA family transporter [Jiangella sp. DSM 45060]|uniref:EamA family transporter n=1 Tax=Jiangella sp. DSM 45060 TaxID=1798224 RepID=UPI00087D77B0|nr:EamA family transporter [Jiangella sp. DSM 45060]SDT67474.1 Permease of the drug/metabolite transporter (DMT) superfamily [Jiangella sp. DSM 45060]
MTQATARPAMIWTALVVVYVVWGSTYLGIRVVVEAGIPPFLGMGLRFLSAGILMLGYLWLRHGRAGIRISGRELRGAAVMGLLLLVLGNAMVAVAEQTVPSGLAALVVGAISLWFVLLQVAGGQRPPWLTWVGVLVGLAGVAVICLPRGGIEGVEAWGIGVLLFGTISWAFGSYLSPRLGLPRNALVASGYEMLAGGVMLTIVSAATGEFGDLHASAVPAKGWLALAYLVLMGSLLAFSAYGYLLANAPLSLIGTYAYVNPVVAVILGWLILSEPVTSIVLVGGALVVGGVVLVVNGERTSAKAPPAERDPDLAPDEALTR